MLYATFQSPTQLYMGRLEQTDKDELNEREDMSVEDGFDQFIKLRNKGVDEQVKVLKEIAEQFAGKPAGIDAGTQLVQLLAKYSDTTEADLAAAGKAVVDSAKPYGRELEVQLASSTVRDLLKSPKGLATAVELSQRAEKLLTESDPPIRTRCH